MPPSNSPQLDDMDDDELREFLEPVRRLLLTDEKEIQSLLARVQRSVSHEDYEFIRSMFEKRRTLRELLEEAPHEDAEEQA